MKFIAGILFLLLPACTDAGCAKIGAIGDPARITCHSGGKVIYDGCSTGKVHNSESSDGYYFRDQETGRLVEISGECFIDYMAPCPSVSLRPNRAAPADAPVAVAQ